MQTLPHSQSSKSFLTTGLVLAGIACLIGAMAAGRFLSDQLALLGIWRLVLVLRPALEVAETTAGVAVVAWPLLVLAGCFRPAGADDPRAAIVVRAIAALGVWALLSSGWFVMAVYSYGWRAENATNADVIPGLFLFLGYVLIGCGMVYQVWKRSAETQKNKSPGAV